MKNLFLRKSIFSIHFLSLLMLCIAWAFLFSSCVRSKAMESKQTNYPNQDFNSNLYENRLIVGYSSEKYIHDIVHLLNGNMIVHIPELNAFSVETKEAVEAVFEKLKSLGDLSAYGIRYVEPVYKRFLAPVQKTKSGIKISKNKELVMPFKSNYTNETLDFYLWGHRAIDVKQSWDEGFEGNEIIIAVLDTGVDGTHPDLAGQVIEGYRPKSGQVIQAYSDSSYGGSHGTHVAGIIAAKKDGKGIVGVAPKAKIMPIVIFDEGGWYVGDDFTARGIVWAVDHGAKILSNSWGGPGYSQLLKDAFDYALERNVIVVAAAGNSSSSQSFMYPANYPGVVQVGAAEYNGGDIKTANFSSRSPSLSISAPGVNILSTMPQQDSYGYDKDSFLSSDNNGYYGFMSGTSMATPYVSGLVALLLQKYPQAKPWQIKGLIEKSALDIDESGVDDRSGYGLLQAKAIKTDIPLSGGTNFFVKVTDAYESWNIPSVFITLIGTSQSGRVVRYFAKTNKDGVAKFCSIPTGKYDVFLGGPDSQERTNVSSFPRLCFRKAEERFLKFEKIVESDSESMLVKLNSSAILSLTNKPEKIAVYFEKNNGPDEIVVERVVDFSSISSYDFSDLSGKYRIKLVIPEKATSNLVINGEIRLNGKIISVTGTVLKGSAETILSDNVSEWWTVFGNGQ